MLGREGLNRYIHITSKNPTKVECHSTKQVLYRCILFVLRFSQTVPSAIWEIFSEFLIFCNLFTSLSASEIIAKYEKRGKYLPMLHETTCDDYLIVKCLLKSNSSRVILLTNCNNLA